MGPRFDERGKSNRLIATASTAMLQWGRALMSAGKGGGKVIC